MNDLRLVNREYTLGENDIPDHLISVPFTNIKVVKKVYVAFKRLNKRLKREHLEPLVIVSGYRTFAYQKGLFERKIQKLMEDGSLCLEEATLKAGQIVAKPGTSEHQTGLAIDVTTLSFSKLEDPLIEAFEETPTCKWLLQNAYLEGFILRYPKDKMDITHITYEPWHFRYVGKRVARAITNNQLCLEEYVLMQKG